MSDAKTGATARFQEIAVRLGQGEESALGEVLREIGPIVAAQLRRRFAGALTLEDLDDVLAQMLYRVWKHREDYRAERSSFLLWCYLIARNIALDAIRDRSRRKAALSELWAELRGRHAASAASSRGPTLAALERALMILAPEDRQILLASVSGEEAWAAQTASEFRLSSGNLRQRRFRALAQLRAEMNRLGHPC